MKTREYRTRVQGLLRAARRWREERLDLANRVVSSTDSKETIQMHIDPVTERALIDAVDAMDD
jgi:hypothetical protein